MAASIKDVRYPRQIYTAKREKIVLGIDNYLSRPDERDTIPPLELHSPYSRFVLTIIDKSGSAVLTPKANIPASDIPGIVEISRIAMLKKTRFVSTGASADSAEMSPAYTQQILLGNFRGRTPAEILLENPESKDGLLKTRNFLADKARQYASNQKQMDAIDDAVKLLETGKLKKKTGAVCSGIAKIYDVSHKYMRDTNDQGHRLFYGMSIICQYGNNYPWTITIENFFAPGLQGPKGGLAPKMNEKNGYAKCSIHLNDMEWSQMVTRLDSDIRYFESSCYGTLYKEAMEIDRRHRMKAKTAESDPAEAKEAA